MSGEGFSPRVEELCELEGEGIVPMTKIDDGGGSGGAPAILELAPGRLGVVNLWRDKLGEPLANQMRKKERRAAGFVLHRRRRGTEAAAKVKGELGRVCLQCESKGESRSSGSSLNSNQERGRRGEAEGSCGGRRLPLMAAASRAGRRKAKRPV
jgi:hypothetical protein